MCSVKCDGMLKAQRVSQDGGDSEEGDYSDEGEEGSEGSYLSGSEDEEGDEEDGAFLVNGTAQCYRPLRAPLDPRR